MWDLSFPPRDRTHILCIASATLHCIAKPSGFNRWATREVPDLLYTQLLFSIWGISRGGCGTPTVKPMKLHEDTAFLPDKDPIISCHIYQKVLPILCSWSLHHFPEREKLPSPGSGKSLCRWVLVCVKVTQFSPFGKSLTCVWIFKQPDSCESSLVCYWYPWLPSGGTS